LTSRAFARIDDRWTHRGLRTIVLENDQIRVEILPDLGARVHRIEHRASGVDLLWHNPRIEPRPVPIGASYDDNFAGGWDELFPNDFAGKVGDETYPDHGELWCQPWQYSVEPDGPESVSVMLSLTGSVTTTVIEKRVTLRAGESQLRFEHTITNTGRAPFEFLWKLHPALAIDPGDRIDVPGRRAELVDPSFGRLSAPAEFVWPIADPPGMAPIDVSEVPALDGTRDFLYVEDLESGWCALRRLRLGLGFGLVFPVEVFSSVWLFMSFGGWRGLETVVLEPCTTVPKDLNQAIRRGTAKKLEPGETLACEVRAVVFEGVDAVSGFSADGAPIR
jgi:galactose mutarotase-like enzyme